MRATLLDLLVTHSYKRAPDDRFELSSGKRSNFYIDCKTTTMRAAAMPLVGQAVAALLPSETESVGGLTLGADAIAGATAFYCQTIGRHVDSFTVRKTAKSHGMMKFIEGCPGARVVVLDDVVTTGGSTIDAIRKCREAGIHVIGVVALVDREEGGMEAVRAEAGAGIPVAAVFKRSELEAHWQSRQAMDAAAAKGQHTAAR
ncbi:MAG: orotate phosphoribosyltransferase [Candidatus Binatia bacterium]